MKLLLTGHLGTVGITLKEKLSADYEVIGFDIKENTTHDITNDSIVKQIFAEKKPDIVVHCAAIPSPRSSMDRATFENFWNVNILGTKHIVFACQDIDIKKLVYISSGCVYGWDDRFNNDETDVKIEPYGTSKRIAEEIVRYAAGQGLKSSILRLAPVGNNIANPKFFNSGAGHESIYKYVKHAIANEKWLSIYNVSDDALRGGNPIWAMGEVVGIRVPYYFKGGVL